MGLIETFLDLIFGRGTNRLRETVEVFRPNAEAQAGREAVALQAALQQFGQEFSHLRPSPFDRLIDGLNRIPRPAMAFGTIGLIAAALVDPVWFAARMQGLALVPEPLWWLLGAIVSFYFGARHQAKGQEFQRSIAATLAQTPQVVENLSTLAGLAEPAAPKPPASNPALADWRASRR